MKRNIIATFALAVTAMAVSAPAVIAESQEQATVPFAFQVGKSALPAGTYVVTASGQGQIAVRNRHTPDQVIGLARAEYNMKPHQAKLIFHEYGTKYFLSEIWSSDQVGSKLPETKQEREYRASNDTPMQEKVVLLAMK